MTMTKKYKLQLEIQELEQSIQSEVKLINRAKYTLQRIAKLRQYQKKYGKYHQKKQIYQWWEKVN